MSSQLIDLTPEKDGGVLKEVKRPTQDKEPRYPWKGDKVYVHYVGTLQSDGSQFDSSRDRGQQFSFSLGKGEVIKGWDLGVASMAVGELAVLTIKSDYGYGDAGSGAKIPGGATLVFEVELFDCHGEDISPKQDKTLIKRTKAAGEGLDHPNDDSLVEVDLKGEHAGRVFDERSLKFCLGEGLEQNVPPAVELALQKMKKKEVGHVTALSSEHAFGEAGWPEQNVPANAQPVVYTVTLKAFERAKESWQLDGEQKLEQARIFKEKGTRFFKQAKFALAVVKYKKIVDFLEHEITLKDALEEERKQLLQAGRLNLAICYLKNKEWIEARNICDKVLEENAALEKAYFRRGEALMHLSDHELAMADFQKAVELDPENKAAKNKVLLCQQELKRQKLKERKTFANMFDKFAQIDTRREEDAKRREKPVEISEWDSEKGGAPPAAAGGGGKKNKTDDISNIIPVSGDINMTMDLNEEIKNDAS